MGLIPMGAGNGSSWDGCCLEQHLLEFVWAPSASPAVLSCVLRAHTRLGAEFNASVMGREGQKGMSPAGRGGLVLFGELQVVDGAIDSLSALW